MKCYKFTLPFVTFLLFSENLKSFLKCFKANTGVTVSGLKCAAHDPHVALCATRCYNQGPGAGVLHSQKSYEGKSGPSHRFICQAY